MDLFIDTADISEIKAARAMGLLDGVTTNPSLIAKAGRDHHELLAEICALVPGPVSAEVLATDFEGMMAEADELAAIAPNIVVKIPLIAEGIRAVHALTQAGIQTNVTLCFSPLQGLLAAKAGATYISPFVGRLDDIGHDGMGLVEQLVEMYERYELDTKVLVASVRSPSHVVEALRLGADVATIPYGILAKLIHHPLTDIGLARFLEDAGNGPGRPPGP